MALRLVRRTLDLAAAISLLAALTIAVQWVRTRNTWEGVQVIGADSRGPGNPTIIWTGFGIGDGCLLAGRCTDGNTLYYSSVLGVSRHVQWIGAHPAGVFPADVYAEILPHVEWQFAGVRHVTGNGHVKTVELASVSLWYFLIALSMPPLLWIRAHVRRKRRSKQHETCPNCGYDLRATPDCCPECGMLVACTRGAEPARAA